MGYPPDLPEGHGGSDLERPNEVNFNPPTSEDSDNNNHDPNESPYSGYEQLTFDGEAYSGNPATEDDDDVEAEEEQQQATTTPPPSYPSDFSEIECAAGNNSLPDVVPVDLELAQQVWNAPPAPDRSNAIQLDDTRTNQIINLMSGINLPSNCIPEWAQTLSEEKWKQELLEKIRRDNSGSGSNK